MFRMKAVKQDWIKPGSTDFFWQVLVFFNFELLKLKISELCLGQGQLIFCVQVLVFLTLNSQNLK